jgi:sulfur transfer complex TusBCD TusB component (DsrH family)
MKGNRYTNKFFAVPKTVLCFQIDLMAATARGLTRARGPTVSILEVLLKQPLNTSPK